jgi:predicted nucleic acid-binding protein
MKALLDTTVLIDHLRGDKKAAQFLAQAVTRGDELWSVTVVRTEVLAGMRPKEEKATKLLLSQIKWLEVDTALADAAGDLARKYMKTHPGVDTVDYIIGAAAQEFHADLKTTNVKHFPMIAGLKKPY